MPTIICMAGIFDTITLTDIERVRQCKELGDKLFIIVRSDKELTKNQPGSYKSEVHRLELVRNITRVDAVVISADNICKTLKMIVPDIYVDWYNPRNKITQESTMCDMLGIKYINKFLKL